MKLSLFEKIKEQFSKIQIPPELNDRIRQATPKLNSTGIDPWGFDPNTYKIAVNMLKGLYTHYFRVETIGLENIPEGRVMLIANHGCQIPLDAVLISGAMILEAPIPRITRAMVDRWVPSLPFISSLFTSMGEVVGAPKNCVGLLEENNCVLIFPEGTKGSGKDIFHRYQLQKFGAGFIHLAVETNSPIIPVAIIGTEEIYPAIFNFKLLAKILRAPYFPITPFFPFFGPLGAIPLPTKVSIIFGEPFVVNVQNPLTESQAQTYADEVRALIQQSINNALKKRGQNIFLNSAL